MTDAIVPAPTLALRGAVPALRELLALRAAAARLTWAPPRTVRASGAGLRSSRFRGRGIDFAETRSYQPGDDVRHIDWRVTARTGRPHTKVFHEERERPILLLADLGPETFFGTRQRLKSLAIAELSALLLWRAYDDGDRVGALLRAATGIEAHRPKKTHQSVLRILERLSQGCASLVARYGVSQERRSAGAPAPSSTPTLAEALRELLAVVRPGTTVVVLSDFASSEEDLDEILSLLGRLGRNATVHGVLVSDPFERETPPAGRYPLSDGLRRRELDLQGPRAGKSWALRYAQRRDQLQRQLQGQGGRLLECATDGDYLRDLGLWLR
ncbi:MAG: DUF58 domain-containing protein [Pseudomonadales bacterium]|nr:DUF58 domain-containing protein [Pseudomonadales bacterium]MBL6808397.1 DUF58 domain-containing protein [Pseudomonadales bacterium]MDA0956083.1 DUF58 domain-containing protein [Pseudomonadota bacterium]